MKYKALKKLNCKRGASLVIALIIFLLCALAGASALAMAATNAGRYSHKNEQEYYPVSSAALLFVDMMDGLKYTSSPVDFNYIHSWEYTSEGGHTTSDAYTLSITDSAKPAKLNGDKLSGMTNLKEMITKQCDALVPYLNVPDEWYQRVKETPGAPTRPDAPSSIEYNFTVQLQNDTHDAVHGKLIMNANYDIILLFDYGDSGAYSISVYWEAVVNENKTASEPKFDYTADHKKGSQTQNNRLQIVVTWDKANVTISRGEATHATV